MRINEAFQSAVQDARAGRFGQAEKKLSTLLEYPLSEKDTGSIRELLGIVYSAMGDYDAAVGELTQAAASKPADPAVHSNLCNCLNEAGRFAEAIPPGRKAVALAPGFPAAHNNLGNALNAAGDSAAAVASYREAVRLQPDNAEFHNNLGVALYEAGDLEGAIASSQKALELRPDFPAAQRNLGEALNDKGNLDTALAVYRDLAKTHPENAAIHNTTGMILEEMHEVDQAIDYYLRALRLDPAFADAHTNLGSAYKLRGDLDEAIASFQEALRLRPDDRLSHGILGMIYSELGRYDEALHHHDKSGSSESRAEALLCLYALGRYDELAARMRRDETKDRVDRHIAAVSSFVATQIGHADRHPFCNDPLKFVRAGNIRDHIDDAGAFLDRLDRELLQVPSVWEPLARTTRNGFQTHGNLFRHRLDTIARLEEIIKAEIALYRAHFAAEDCLYIRMWPKDSVLTGWSVRLHQGGHQRPHIHPTGWISGVIYVKLVETDVREEGDIVFGRHADDYPLLHENVPTRQHHPQRGDIVLFPSSLYHHTIPFRKEGERLTVSFDLMPR